MDPRATSAAIAVPVPARRLAWVAALVAALVALVLVPVPAPAEAAPDGGLEARFVALINQERADAGLPALRVANDLVAVGRRQAERMAGAADLHHNPDLGSDVSGWDKVGENVGRGPDVDRIHAAFMASPSHRRNVFDAEWTEVGVGVEVVDGGLWVTELFRLPRGATAPTPEPEPATAAEPAPARGLGPGTGAPASAAAPADAPTSADPEPAPTVERDVVTVAPSLDRISLIQARLDAAADLVPLEVELLTVARATHR